MFVIRNLLYVKTYIIPWVMLEFKLSPSLEQQQKKDRTSQKYKVRSLQVSLIPGVKKMYLLQSFHVVAVGKKNPNVHNSVWIFSDASISKSSAHRALTDAC